MHAFWHIANIMYGAE